MRLASLLRATAGCAGIAWHECKIYLLFEVFRYRDAQANGRGRIRRKARIGGSRLQVEFSSHRMLLASVVS
ncbi:hypothetical protein VAPA_2c09310 [Variovorax paradoxus B4]|uniref:Uncharacterized protein n=1 Tax=Variovorax paradoxus B4 TaxID=1246301 RepID=T1XKS1_VARPD|nr:hypothetical protein VAPA_2c09310 [Variovorax paradoxus B4]